MNSTQCHFQSTSGESQDSRFVLHPLVRRTLPANILQTLLSKMRMELTLYSVLLTNGIKNFTVSISCFSHASVSVACDVINYRVNHLNVQKYI